LLISIHFQNFKFSTFKILIIIFYVVQSMKIIVWNNLLLNMFSLNEILEKNAKILFFVDILIENSVFKYYFEGWWFN